MDAAPFTPDDVLNKQNGSNYKSKRQFLEEDMHQNISQRFDW